MDASRHLADRAALALAALALAGAAGGARALDLSLQLNPSYNRISTVTTDETGHQTRTEGTVYQQRYRLGLDDQLFPQLKVSAGGLLDWTNGTTRSEGTSSISDTKKWLVYAGTRFGDQLFSGGVDTDYRSEVSDSRSAGVTTTSPVIDRQTTSANLGWAPADLPVLSLRMSHQATWDRQRTSIDQSSDEASLSGRYQPAPTVSLQYGLRAGDSADHLNGVDTTEVSNSLAATWSDTFAGRRGTAYVGYNVSARASNTTLTRQGGSARVLTRQVPLAGLSIVDGLTTTPDRVALNPNAALVDGDTVASAGLNLGTTASPVGLGQPRELGAQFANAITPVNTVLVWVNKPLGSLAGLFTFAVWQSDDNLSWTAVADPLPPSAVTFSLVPGQPSFELRLSQPVQARYLKVVVRPLPASATIDPQFAEILVTELQFFLAVAAEQARGHSTALGGSLNASVRYTLLEDPSLTFDSAANLTHGDTSTRATWSLINGLSLARRLGRTLALSARVDRSDADFGRGHESGDRWSATLAAELLPTLSLGASYGGSYTDGPLGHALGNSLSAFGRADLYEGISLNGNGSLSQGRNAEGQDSLGSAVAASFSLVPNRWCSLSGGANYTRTSQSGGGRPASTQRRSALEANATLVPLPSLFLYGGFSRSEVGSGPQTLVNFGGSFTPFQGGTLTMRYSYQETLDDASATRTRSHGPSLRWTIRPGWFLDGSYGFLDTTTPAQRTSSQVLSVNLMINLH